MYILTSSFPCNLKYAEAIPISKKGDTFNKPNYIPVSILPSISKIFEEILIDQMSLYFEHKFSHDISGFSKCTISWFEICL